MSLRYYLDIIEDYEKEYSSWYSRGDKIKKRYEDEKPANSKKRGFNIFWSNVQTLAPALYDRSPNPNIARRNMQKDDLGLVASTILERCANYFIKNDVFDTVMNQAVLDRLLQGRGGAWVRYVPTIEGEDVAYEDAVIDYVNIKDFGHNVARTWEEVTIVWRKSYLDRKELVSKFGDVGLSIPLDSKKKGAKEESETGKKATIYELWDKTSKQVVWLHKDHKSLLLEKPDFLNLKGFFPCPKPVYSTLTNDTLIPTPDYAQYQDQAMELDDITARISLLISALKVVGVYDANAQGVQKLLSDTTENKLIPVEQWAIFAEKGGIKGVVDFFPIDQISAVLQGLFLSRDKIKQDIYEITGISDIIRGASNPNETLGAQELKGKYAGLRLGAMQRDVARFSRSLVEMVVEIVAEHFDLETIKQISGYKLLSMAEKQQIDFAMKQYPMMMQQAQATGQQPPPPPVDEETMELMNQPSWEDVEGLIRSDMPRCFVIDIETDSTIKVDQDAEKQSRVEFLTAVSGFMKEAAQIQDPALKPLFAEMLMFGVRGFKAGRELESAFETAIDKMKKESEAPQNPQPDPEMEKAKIEAEATKAQIEIEKIKASSSIELANIKLQEKQIDLLIAQSKTASSNVSNF
jgi:hypothetical protein